MQRVLLHFQFPLNVLHPAASILHLISSPVVRLNGSPPPAVPQSCPSILSLTMTSTVSCFQVTTFLPVIHHRRFHRGVPVESLVRALTLLPVIS